MNIAIPSAATGHVLTVGVLALGGGVVATESAVPWYWLPLVFAIAIGLVWPFANWDATTPARSLETLDDVEKRVAVDPDRTDDGRDSVRSPDRKPGPGGRGCHHAANTDADGTDLTTG